MEVSIVARQLTAPGPLDTLEEAFDLLQSAPASVWFRYLIGAGPLIVSLLLVWNEFSSNPAANPVIGSGFLVVALVWFYRCRQIFAGHLRRIIGLARAADPTARPAWSLACFEGTKLIAIPISALSIVPAAYATAFYRSLTLFAGQGQSPRDAVSNAWKASTPWQRENWFILAIVTLLSLAVFIDVAIMVVVAPTLVKIFTGYESILAQRGADALSIQLPIIVALTWLCLDPLLQAVYTVRAFKWEGLRTGEDLLVRLKRLAPILILVAACLSPCRLAGAAQPTLSRDTLNSAIDQTLQSRDYNWRTPPADENGAAKKDWFLDTVDRAVVLIQEGWRAITDLVSDLLGWIDRLLRPIMPASDRTQAGKPSAVRPVFYVFGIAIVALALVLLWKFGPRRIAPIPVPVAAAGAVDLNNEGLLASDLPEDEWLRMADRYASSGDLRLALRALYLGTLALLSHRGFVTIHACKSNRDYERELRRRSRDSGLNQIFCLNIRSFEQSWYGFHEVTGAQIQDFRDNLGRMRSNAA
jgi:hypothetical protein